MTEELSGVSKTCFCEFWIMFV